MITRRRNLIGLVLLPVALMLGLGWVTLASAHPTGPAPRTVAAGQVASLPAGGVASAHVDKRKQIYIHEFVFTVPAKVKAGSLIKIVNSSHRGHTVTADDRSFDVLVAPHSSKLMKVPETAGSYSFFCKRHTGMRATLVVK